MRDAAARHRRRAGACRSPAWWRRSASEDLRKVPGIAETLDWAATLAGLDVRDLRDAPEAVHETLICLLKTHEDRARVTREVTDRLLGQGGVDGRAAITTPKRIGAAMRTRLAGFARTLRDNGFKVGLAETADALAILASPAAARPSALRPALKSLFCATHSDWEKFDEIFDAYWLGHGMRARPDRERRAGRAPSVVAERCADADASQAPGEHARPRRTTRGSDSEAASKTAAARARRRAELLSSTDLRHIVDPDDIAKAHALAARLAQHHAGAAGAPPARCGGAGAGSISAAPSTAASPTAARRSSSCGGTARSSRCAWSCCSMRRAR